MSSVVIQKRGNYWQYRFDTAKIEGKRNQISKSGFKTKAEARAAGIEAWSKFHNKGIVETSTRLSLADYLDYWFQNYCRMNLKYNTQLGYLNIIENHLKPSLGSYYLKDINPTIVQEYTNSLKMKGLSKSSTIGIISTLSCAFKYAINPLNYVSVNPCQSVIYPKFENNRDKKRYLITSEDFQRIMDRFPPSSPWHIPLMIGYHTGLRIGEVFALTWDDIDLENQTLSVNKIVIKRNYGMSPLKTFKELGKKEEKSGWYFGSPKTRSSNRVILMDSKLTQALRDEKAKQMMNRKYYGKHYSNIYKKEETDEKGDIIYRLVEVEQDIPIFLPEVRMVCVKDNGEYASSDGFKYCARVVHHELKIAFNFHSLRHTHATILVQDGAPIKDIQERLGHNRIDTTLGTYTHNTLSMKQASVSIFERHLEAHFQKN